MKPITDKMVEDMFEKSFKPLARKLDNLQKSFKSNEYYIIQTVVQSKFLHIEQTKILNPEKLITLLEYYIVERDTDINKLLEIEILDAIINDSLMEKQIIEPEDIKMIRSWLETEIIPEAIKQIALIPTDEEIEEANLKYRYGGIIQLFQILSNVIRISVDRYGGYIYLSIHDTNIITPSQIETLKYIENYDTERHILFDVYDKDGNSIKSSEVSSVSELLNTINNYVEDM